MSLKVLLADDHQVMREGLRDFIQNLDHLEVIGEAENGHTAVEKARQLSPDLVIMDVGMPGLNGIDATREIINENPNIKVIGLSMHSDKRFVLDMLKAGASAYLIKDEVSEEMANAIKAVCSDVLFVSPRIGNGEIEAYIQKTRGNANYKETVMVRAKPAGGLKALSKAIDEIEIAKAKSQKAVKELKESEERLRILFEFAPDAFYLNDLKGRWQGKSLGDKDLTFLCEDGTQRHTVSRLFPLHDYEGNVTECVFANTDITDQKKVEKKLKEYSENLEAMVEERTQELRKAQEELIRRERLAVLGQLTDSVEHDLRTPLGAIKNAQYFLNMTLEKPDPETKEILRIIEKEVSISERIINGLLNFARPRSSTKRIIERGSMIPNSTLLRSSLGATP